MKPIILDFDRIDGAEARKAYDKLMKMGLPDSKNEEYRYFDIEPLMMREWDIFQSPIVSDGPAKGERVVITDGVVTEIPADGSVTLSTDSDMKIESDHFDPLYYLSHAGSPVTSALRFKKDCRVEIEYRYTQPQRLLLSRVAIFVDANVEVEIFERFSGVEATGSFVVDGYDLFASAYSRVTIVREDTLYENGYIHISPLHLEVDAQASVKLKTFDFGDGQGLTNFTARLHDHAEIEADHLLYASRNARRGTVSKIIHRGLGSHSDQKGKSILGDSARGIFDALIRVEHSGKYTKAHQNSKAILLDSGAYMASKPQLEIYIDDLEASHGSTTGQLDERALFYLRSRGIDEDKARQMLILAFANELIDDISVDGWRDRIHLAFEEAYCGGARLECMSTCHNCENTIVGE